jgi:sterol desaturase/sphingolipid hydroxylase (fatty acid hydroxylase superfamily)
MQRNALPTPRIRLFRNDRLERLTTVSPVAFGFLWLLVLALAVYAGKGAGPVWQDLGLFSLGLLGWTLFEYMLHRFVFHVEVKTQSGHKLAFLFHGNHHASPSDSDRNLMPPIVSIPIALFVWGTLAWIFGAVGSILFVGFISGYIAYDGLHYACHQYTMPGGVLRRIQQHHLRHHYARQQGNYAVTAIFLDKVFGTKVSADGRWSI